MPTRSFPLVVSPTRFTSIFNPCCFVPHTLVLSPPIPFPPRSFRPQYFWDKVKCKLRAASCELQKLTLYHNIYLQSFSTLKKMLFRYMIYLIVQLHTAVGLYIKCHTGVAVDLSTRINMVFRCWHLRSRLHFFLMCTMGF